MQNYVIENNIDFYEELKKYKSSSSDKMCLLTHEPLSDNYITFPCNHTFNYVPLCKEIINSKNAYINYKCCKPLNPKTTTCPYCRKTFDKKLPYIPLYGIKNSSIFSSINCFNLNKCDYKIKTGKNKGNICKCNSAFKNIYGTYCIKHYTSINKLHKCKKIDEKILEHKDAKKLYRKKKIELQDLLRDKGLPINGKKIELVKRLLE